MKTRQTLRLWAQKLTDEGSSLGDGLLEYAEAWDDEIEQLREELRDWVNNYGCDCGHPACKRCRETESSLKLLGEG